MVYQADCTLALSNEINIIGLVILEYYRHFWKRQLRRNLLNHVLYDIIFLSKYFVVFYCILKYLLSHFIDQRRRYDSQKLLEFLLLIKIALSPHQVFSDLILNLSWQMHIFH